MGAEAKTNSWSDVLTTPLGSISCSALSSLPFEVGPDGLSRTSGTIHIRQESFDLPVDWNRGLDPLPEEIDGGRCWRWYFKCGSEDPPEIDIRCGLNVPSDAIWDTANRENLVAMSYKLLDEEVHIGTEDHKLLYTRTLSPAGLFPARFKDLLALPTAFAQGLITLGHSGVVIRVPRLQRGERLYFHMIAAYKHIMRRGDISTWNAVDRAKCHIDEWQLGRGPE